MTKRRFQVGLVLTLTLFLGLASFRQGGTPTISIDSDLPGIGRRTQVVVSADEPKRGLTGLRVELVQEDRVVPLVERSFAPRSAWMFWGPMTVHHEFTFQVGLDVGTELDEGVATIRATAESAPAWLRRPPPAVEELNLPVRLRPPSLQILSRQHYVAQGGAEIVVYRSGESTVRDGVQVGEAWFPGYPLPGGGERDRLALFAVPFDLEGVDAVQLVAEDDVGNRGRLSFVDRFSRKPFRRESIRLSDNFLRKVVPEILANTPGLRDRGTDLENYLMINGELRAQNAATLRDFAKKSRRTFLWRRGFLPFPNSQVMSSFADRRTYLYEGREVDQQDHLGFDLASVSRAEVPSANDGVVLLARYFGIYGNAVLVDHGYGLMSLYGHLSSIAVAEGEEVRRGQSLGHSGETGLAGGDHLHFTMLLQGEPVNPVEWWDDHWIRDRLGRKLGNALRFQGS